MNALAKLIENYRKRRNITQSQLAPKLQYQNINKFCRKLELATNELKDSNDLIKQTVLVLNIPEYLFIAARSEVVQQLNEKLKSQFKPSVHIVYQHRLNMTTAWGRSLSVEPFELTGHESIEKQFYKAACYYHAYAKKYSDVNGYIFNRTHLESYRFDNEGKYLGLSL